MTDDERFLALFKDPLFVAIPFDGGALLHSKDLKKVLARNNVATGDGAYFTVNGFANFREKDYHGRTKANVTSFNCNFLDIDLTPETKRTEADLIYRELCGNGLKPTAVVLTGKGLHVYWLYKEPYPFSEKKLSEYEVLQSAIVEHYKGRGADSQARDAARVLRVPGAKYFDKTGAHTADIELLHLNGDEKYTSIEMADYFKATIKMDTREGEKLLRLGDDFDFAKVLNVKKGSRHHDAYSAALSLIQRTKDLPSARKMFQATLGTWESPREDPLDWRDAWSQFENAKRAIEKEMPQAFIGDPETLKVSIALASDVEMRPIEWLWDGFIARGKAHMLTGEPGLGKSQLTTDIAARLSTGRPLPSYTLAPQACEPTGVLILSAEDDAADTMVPRLVAAGADLKNVGFIASSIIERGADKKPRLRALALKEDAEKILEAIARLPMRVGLVVIDPVSAFLSGAQDSNSNSDARGTLAQLQAAVMDKGIAVLMVNHTNKNTAAKSAHMRSMGSVGWNAAARATFYVFKDDGKEGRRVFSVGKTNLAKESGAGFFYSVVEEKVEIRGEPRSVPRIEWSQTEFPTRKADDYASDVDGKKALKRDECQEELELFMAGRGDTPSGECVLAMKERGFSQAEVYRAARRLGIIKAYGTWGRN